jgi:C_GCAxxG_C_C family probable redox protein
MDRVEAAVELFRSGCACSQAVFGAFAPVHGVDESHALRLASGFAAGMRMGGTCGAVTGGLMALGLAVADDPRCRTADGRQQVYAAVNEFCVEFRRRRGGLDCRELLGCDISTPEGLQQAKDKDLFATTCVELVRDAATIVDGIIA